MQDFDMESTFFERGWSLLHISIKKSFLIFLIFSPILAYISLSVIDNMVPFYMDARIYKILFLAELWAFEVVLLKKLILRKMHLKF